MIKMAQTISSHAIYLISLLTLSCPQETPPPSVSVAPCCIPIAGNETQCMSEEEAANQIVFVDVWTGNDGYPGGPNNPLQSIRQALKQAQQQGKTNIYVSAGLYSETVDLISGISIYGGFSRSLCWAFDPHYQVRIQGDSVLKGDPIGVNAVGISAPTVLANMEVISADAIQEGKSSYGLYCYQCTDLILRSMVIRSGNGARGQNGQAGMAGTPGGNGYVRIAGGSDFSPGGNGGLPGGIGTPISPKTEPGKNGENGKFPGGGAGGIATPAGVSNTNGDIFPSATNGQNGQDGQDGQDGLGGQGGQVSFGISWLSFSGEEGGNGTNGFGGGGGGGTGSIQVNYGAGSPYVRPGSHGGGGGGGGSRGSGGLGGFGGGGSFGVFISASQRVTIENCTIESGRGAEGGAGGVGGSRGQGGLGAGGGTGSSTTSATFFGAGGRGGNGGFGGRGGHGGGGAGGPSIGMFSVNAQVLMQGNNSIIAGFPGSGGSSLGNRGQDGISQQIVIQ